MDDKLAKLPKLRLDIRQRLRASKLLETIVDSPDDAAFEIVALRDAVADDIRKQGWCVAVHNDYRLHGRLFTFWLFTKGDRCVKGEGSDDAEALNKVRAAIREMK